MDERVLETEKREDFKQYLMDMERSPNTIDSYIRSVDIFFQRYQEVSKKNLWILRAGS